MPDLLGDDRDELDGGGAGADYRYALAAEIDFLLGPPGGVIRLAPEGVDTLKRGNVARRQDSYRGDQELRAHALTILELDLPSVGALVVHCRSDVRVELDVAAQIEPVGHVIQVTLVLRLTGKVLLPVPFLEEFL